MRLTHTHTTWLCSALVVLIASGCDGVSAPTVPEAPVTPDEARLMAAAEAAQVSAGPSFDRGQLGWWRRGDEFAVLHYLRGQEASDAPDADRIGRRGGWLNIGRQAFLYIPRNAVSSTAEFTMSLVSSDEGVGVDLTATSRRGETNDVGAAGFRRPVLLCLYYRNSDLAELGYTAEDLSVAWRVDDADVRPTVSFLYEMRRGEEGYICGTVHHFSGYI
ncbi:MAG: hypothetical protein ACREIV_16085, partial [Planctomycetaceae bacterium]